MGTLTQVVVSLDPVPVPTSSYDAGFLSIPSHTHDVSPSPVMVPGLGTFSFVTTTTSPGSSGSFGSHSHLANPYPSVKVYNGAGLSWFLNPLSPTITTVSVPSFPTSQEQSHAHTVHLQPIVPITTYTFDLPVPEPASVVLASAGWIAPIFRRRDRR